MYIVVVGDNTSTLNELYKSYIDTSLAMGLSENQLTSKTTVANIISRLHPEKRVTAAQRKFQGCTYHNIAPIDFLA